MILVTQYNESSSSSSVLSEKKSFRADQDKVSWVHFANFTKNEILIHLEKYDQIHHLVAEDFMNTEDLPKVENLDECVLITVKVPTRKQEDASLEQLHVSLVLLEEGVLSLQEKGKDFFVEIQNRIKNNGGRVRRRQADYLFYLLLNVAVKHYFNILDQIRERIMDLDEQIEEDFHNSIITEEIFVLRREIALLRRWTAPMRRLLLELRQNPSPLIQEQTLPYLKDVEDQIDNITSTCASLREMLKDTMDIQSSKLNAETNHNMKKMTALASIFIPLTFLAGLYGMNFKYMPGIEAQWGFEIILGVMLGIALTMIFIMHKQRML